MKKLYYTWDEFEDVCKHIENYIKKQRMFDKRLNKSHNIKYIYGLPRGGLCLAVKLSHLLNAKLVDKPINSSNCLIIDEISDTGKTLIKLNNKYPKCPIATWHIKSQTKFIPLIFYAEIQNNIWTVYPWENSKKTNT